jgi:hypothetical protein
MSKNCDEQYEKVDDVALFYEDVLQRVEEVRVQGSEEEVS